MIPNKHHKILWLDINSSYAHSSLALPAIEAQNIIHKKNITWSVVSGVLKSNISKIVSNIIEESPEILCFTSWLFTHSTILEILSRVNAINPNIIIIGGGPEYLGDNKCYLTENSFINYIIRGEGEEVFYQWIDSFEANCDFDKINGICYIDSNGNYIDNGIAKVRDITKLKYPENSSLFDWNKPFIQVETTRGCFNSCAFCVSGNDKPIRSISLENIEKRIENIYNKGIRDVRMLDRTFNSNTKRALELLDIFNKFDSMRFHLEIHPALLEQKLIDKITELPIGKLHLEAGMQSLDDKVLEKCNRAGEKERSLDGLKKLCQIKNIITHTDLIAGLPLYTLEQIYNDIKTLSQIDTQEIQLESLKLLPGTEMRRNAETLKLKYSPKPPYEVLQTPNISINQISEAMSLSRILDFYYNTDTWHDLFRKLIISENDFLKNFVAYMINNDCIDSPLSMEKRGLLLYNYLIDNGVDYITEFKVEWIKNGLPLRKEPTNDIVSSNIEIRNDAVVILGEYEETMRKYHFSCKDKTYIFGFDRSKSHCKPIFIATQSTLL